MPQDDLATEWKSFDEAKRTRLLGKMTPDQKKKLRSTLEAKPQVSAAPAPKTGAGDEIAAEQQRYKAASPIERGMSSFATGFGIPQSVQEHPTKALEGIGLAIRHPGLELDSLQEMWKGMNESQQKVFERAFALQDKGGAANKAKAFAMATAAYIPMFGPAVVNAVDQWRSGDKAGAVGSLSAIFTQVAVPKVAESAAGEVPKGWEPAPKVGASRSPALKKLVTKTVAENAADAAETAKENAATTKAHLAKTKAIEESNRAAQAKHQQSVDNAARENLKGHIKHLSEKADVEHANAESGAAQEARSNLERDIRQDAEMLDVKTEKARHDALAEGNKKYSAVNEKLSPIAGDTGALTGALYDSMSRISGTETEPPILKSISDRLGGAEESGVGDTAYSDLQGYYSELGRELSKGTLPGDVYSAYDTMHEAIGEEMQKIADANGAGQQLTDARAYWKRMKQTFGKSVDTATNRAAKFVGDEAGDVVEQQQRDYRLRLLGSFDESIPGLAEKISGARSKLKTLPTEAAGPKALPRAPEAVEAGSLKLRRVPEEPKLRQPAPKKIGQAEVEAAKRETIQKRADWVRNRGQWAATWPAFHALRGFPLFEAGAEAAGTLAATHAIARALENPRVVEFLSNATAKDIAAIPPDLRGSFPGIIKQAQRQGRTVSPALRILVGGAAGTAGSLAPRRHPSDVYSDPAQLQQ